MVCILCNSEEGPHEDPQILVRLEVSWKLQVHLSCEHPLSLWVNAKGFKVTRWPFRWLHLHRGFNFYLCKACKPTAVESLGSPRVFLEHGCSLGMRNSFSIFLYPCNHQPVHSIPEDSTIDSLELVLTGRISWTLRYYWLISKWAWEIRGENI